MAGPLLHSHRMHAVLQAHLYVLTLSAGPLLYYCCIYAPPQAHSYICPPHPRPHTHLHHLAALQLCAHFTYAPSTGPLVCLHPLSGPTAVFPAACLQLPRPARMTNPPSTYTIQVGPQPYFHSVYTHSAGPLMCSHSWRAHGEQDPLELAWGVAYQKRE